MFLGFDGDKGVARVCSLSQSSKLTFEFREWADASNPGSIDASHKGPCAVYMKAVDNAMTDTGYGAGWFKIWDDGYDSGSGEWCTEKLIANNGLLSVNVPDDLAAGYYLVRPELLALQEADKTPSDPQFYIGCAQVFLQSAGTSVPQDTVSIPGYVTADEPSVKFNIYNPVFPYTVPGPLPYQSIASDSLKSLGVSQVSQTEGMVPANAVLINANWFGTELDSYTDEAGCWNASNACWKQATSCYDMAPPTGSKNCPLWEAKCKGIDSACNAGDFSGPPNKGTDLTPAVKGVLSIPPAATTIYGASYTLTLTADTATESIAIPKASSTKKPGVAVTTARSSTLIYSTVTSSLPPSTPTGLAVSEDATCGGTSGNTCSGSSFGNCCSKKGWCGDAITYCGVGCQDGFGDCGPGAGLKLKGRAVAVHNNIVKPTPTFYKSKRSLRYGSHEHKHRIVS